MLIGITCKLLATAKDNTYSAGKTRSNLRSPFSADTAVTSRAFLADNIKNCNCVWSRLHDLECFISSRNRFEALRSQISARLLPREFTAPPVALQSIPPPQGCSARCCPHFATLSHPDHCELLSIGIPRVVQPRFSVSGEAQRDRGMPVVAYFASSCGPTRGIPLPDAPFLEESTQRL